MSSTLLKSSAGAVSVSPKAAKNFPQCLSYTAMEHSSALTLIFLGRRHLHHQRLYRSLVLVGYSTQNFAFLHLKKFLSVVFGQLYINVSQM
jgi:hypothetical protein